MQPLDVYCKFMEFQWLETFQLPLCLKYPRAGAKGKATVVGK